MKVQQNFARFNDTFPVRPPPPPAPLTNQSAIILSPCQTYFILGCPSLLMLLVVGVAWRWGWVGNALSAYFDLLTTTPQNRSQIYSGVRCKKVTMQHSSNNHSATSYLHHPLPHPLSLSVLRVLLVCTTTARYARYLFPLGQYV